MDRDVRLCQRISILFFNAEIIGIFGILLIVQEHLPAPCVLRDSARAFANNVKIGREGVRFCTKLKTGAEFAFKARS